MCDLRTALPVVCTKFIPPTAPLKPFGETPFIVMDDPINDVPVPVAVPSGLGPGPEKITYGASWQINFSCAKEIPNRRKRILTVSLIFMIMIFRSSGPVDK